MKVTTTEGIITASKSMLNLIAIMGYDSAKQNKERGHHRIAQTINEIANAIHDQLDKSGYYDSVK